MSLIKINPDEVRQVASQFKQASQQSEQMVTSLTGTVHNMESDWAGMTKDQFTGEFRQWETTMKHYVELLNNIGVQLDQIAERFAEADQSGVTGAQPAMPRGRNKVEV